MTLATFLLVLIFFVVLYFLVTPMLSPLLSKEAPGTPGNAQGAEDLRYRKAEVLESLKEFDLDLKMKKISDQDYQTLFQETFAEGAKILREIDQRAQEAEQPPPETTPQARETRPPSHETPQAAVPKFCSQCGAALEAGANFCSRCGRKIQRVPL
ncbi:MAG TPA: zinc ribbon domain-containing protein [bacterium]|nr:zinc ribbon domain-containing protein [bacterium]